MENVSPILAPDKSLMLQHLGLLFGRALSGRIEITALHTDKAARHGARTRFFDVGDHDEISDHAASLNAEPGWNVYVGAALRNDDVFPGKAADDSDFYKTYALWADADDGDQLNQARDIYRNLGIAPPFVVVTGRTPSKRAQLWWPLDLPIDDIDILRASLRGIAATLKTDPKVCTGKQLMRLGGSVNWPKKDDRILERTEVVIVESAAREFSVEQMHRAFPPLDRAALDATGIGDVVVAHGGALGLDEKIMDGREGYAFKLVRAHLHEFIGTTGSEPTPDELYRSVAPVYLKKADQVRPGRGPDFLKIKCGEALRSFSAGQIPFMRTVEEAVQTYVERHPEGPAQDKEVAQSEDDDPFRASDFVGEPPARRWVVQDWIIEGAVNSLYGDGGVGKTLLAQQLACSVSLGALWLGLPTTKGAVLAVLCEDEKDELQRRHADIKAGMGHTIGNPFSDVWLWPRVGVENILLTWSNDGKPSLGTFTERLTRAVRDTRPALLILDTLADFYAANEIARAQVNYFVKVVLGGLIKTMAAEDHTLTILLLGHPSDASKATGKGYSGSTAWNAAVRSRMYLSRPEDGASDERILTRGKANYASSGDETAVRLFYANGVLHAADDVDDGDSLLWGAMRDAVSMVEHAWNAGTPYSGKVGSKRHIHAALAADLVRNGYTMSIARQAIRTCIDDQQVTVSASNGKRGYRGQK